MIKKEIKAVFLDINISISKKDYERKKHQTNTLRKL
jgi:hypothetical protein